MAYSKNPPTKTSDDRAAAGVLILRETLRPGEKLPPEREPAKQFDRLPSLLARGDSTSSKKGCCFVAVAAEPSCRAACGRASDPLVELLRSPWNPSLTCSKRAMRWKALRLITRRHAAPTKIKDRIREPHHAIELAQESGDSMPIRWPCSSIKSPSPKRRNNVVLLHPLRCMERCAGAKTCGRTELLYARREMLPLVSTHRTRIFEAIAAGNQKKRVKRHTAIWRLSKEETMLDRSREESRRERAYAVWSSARISFSGRTLTEDAVNKAQKCAR